MKMKYVILLLILLICNARARTVLWPPNKYSYSRMNDRGHNILPKLPIWLADFTLFITCIFAFIYRKKLNFHSITIVLIMFYISRIICIASTVLPKIDGNNSGPRLLSDSGDYIFSGHTTFNLILSYAIGAPIYPLWPLLTSAISVSTRDHYTIDVVLPWILLWFLKTSPL